MGSARYCRGGDVSPLTAAESFAVAKELPEGCFIDKPGVYAFAGEAWPVEKEGLYRFCGADGQTGQRCYFKKDAFALMSALFNLSAYVGKTLEVGHFDILNHRLANKDEENFPPFALATIVLHDLFTAWRHVALYSPVVGNSVFDWIEVWNEETGAWELYWPENYAFLGAVGKERTCFDVFASFARGEGEVTLIAPTKPLYNGILARAGLLEDVRAALDDRAKLAEIIGQLKMFPVIRDRGRLVARAAAQEEYGGLCPDKKARLGGNPDLEYAVSFLAEDDLRERVYGKQIYIVWRRLIRTGG
ncbi:MAG: hypothetical protein LBO03_10515 [Acidaminococcales bacterium]|jgi:hypothetical protein|nr:hypothetical protein [Acidaminococcales bacterium]